MPLHLVGPADMLVQACLTRMQATTVHGWKLHSLTSLQTVRQHLPNFEFHSWMMTPTHRADWLRVCLLAEHGGVWIDASVIMVDDIETMLAPYWKDGSFFCHFNPLNMCLSEKQPVIEVSLMASVHSHPFVLAWRDEYASVQHFNDPAAYALARQEQGVNLQKGVKIVHHTLNHAAQCVIQKQPNTLRGVVLENASMSFLRVQLLCRWEPDSVMFGLAAVPALDCADRPAVKITSFERRLLKQRTDVLHPKSLLGRLIQGTLPCPSRAFESPTFT